jgi:predicted 3-demethylubiquinone-9 3-methyltransferase (glyoxalase superfamily)
MKKSSCIFLYPIQVTWILQDNFWYYHFHLSFKCLVCDPIVAKTILLIPYMLINYTLYTILRMQKIIPCLWFDDKAEEAATFYASVFKNSKIGDVTRYGKEGYEIHRREAGSVLTVDFEIEGQKFVALNGGPVFKFNEAISFQVRCETQKEIDYYWEKLSEGGDKQAQQCGWLKDKYGVSWQIVPIVLGKMLQDKDTKKSDRVMKALLQMRKLDIMALMRAYEEK